MTSETQSSRRQILRQGSTTDIQEENPASLGETAAPPIELRTLFGFEVCVDGEFVPVPNNVERILAFLAVRGRPEQRVTVASTLWIDSTQDRAGGNLRTALWKAKTTLGDCIRSRGHYLSLSPSVTVDLATLVERARRLISRDTPIEVQDDDPNDLIGDLLPEWDEEWVLFERERLRQLRIHALEALCTKLSEDGRPARAIDAGLAAVAAEPLRESAQRVLICAHLREGNVSEAWRQYHLYRDILWHEMRIEPSETLRELVGVTAKSS